MSQYKSILFDFEYRESFGLGHLSRCLALAETARSIGWDCFVKPNISLPNKARELLQESGFVFEMGIPAKLDFQIVDKYQIASDLRVSRNAVVIQLVDQTSSDFGADAYVSVSPTENWTLDKHLHKPFFNDPLLRKVVLDRALKKSATKNDRILLILGGTNQTRIRHSVLTSLRSSSSSLPIDMLVSNEEGPLDVLGTNVNLVAKPRGYLELIDRYSIVISACGVSAWELLALRKKVCFFALVENQVFQLNHLKKLGLQSTLNFNIVEQSFDNFIPILERLLEETDTTYPQIHLDGSQRVLQFMKGLL